MSYGDYQDKKYFWEMAAKAGVEQIPWVKEAINSTAFLQDPKRRQRLLKYLSVKLQQNVKQDHPLLPAPTREQSSQGVYKICDVITGKGAEYPATIRRFDVPLNGIFVGPVGAGKTTLLVNLGQQIHRDGINPDTGERETAVWFVDTEGQLKSYLAAPAAQGCQDVLIIVVKEMFKLNRWRSFADIPPKEHITNVTVLDRENRYLRDNMMYQLRDAAFELANRQRIFNERHLLEHISTKQYKPGSRNFLAQESLVLRLRDSVEYIESVYDTTRSHDLAALTHRSVVWELEGLSSDHIAIFVNDLLLQLREMMAVHYKPVLKIVIAIDEFSHICNINRLKRADFQEAIILQSFRAFRKRGGAFIVATQEPFSVPGVVLSNIDGFWVAFRPTEGYSARILTDNFCLNHEQDQYMMQMPERQVMCRTKGYPKAFLGCIPQIDLPVATEAEIAERIEYTRQVLDSLLEPEPQPEQLSLSSEKPTEEQAQTLFGYYKLTKSCLDYLEFLAQPSHLFLPITELDELDWLSQHRSNLIRQQLKDTGPGLINIHRIPTGKKGGPLSVVLITEAGYHLLAKLGVKCERPVGHAGTEHGFWQYTIYRWSLSQGFPAEIEQWSSGKNVDVGVKWQERKVAVEVALDNMEKEISNLVKDLETGWDKVVFAVLSDKELNRLKNEIAKRFGSNLLEDDKVGFMKLKTFLETKKHQKQTDPQSKNAEDTK